MANLLLTLSRPGKDRMCPPILFRKYIWGTYDCPIMEVKVPKVAFWSQFSSDKSSVQYQPPGQFYIGGIGQ